MTFSMTVRWANRLKDWNTMPIRRRMAYSCWGLAPVRGWPSTVISPTVGSSRRLRQRSRVLLPVPEGPMMEITSPRQIWVFTS